MMWDEFKEQWCESLGPLMHWQWAALSFGLPLFLVWVLN